MTKEQIIAHLKSKKEEYRQKYGITTLGLYGSYARGEATSKSDVDIFYERDENFSMGLLEFSQFLRQIQGELGVEKVDFVRLESMNPIVKHYAKKDFIYV